MVKTFKDKGEVAFVDTMNLDGEVSFFCFIIPETNLKEKFVPCKECSVLKIS
jgi:hypothetical protein